jgi:hypothetical protein
MKELFVKRLSDGRLFHSFHCSFYNNFKQVHIETDYCREFILNEGEFEVVYKEIESYIDSYEEYKKIQDLCSELYIQLSKEFREKNPEPQVDWESEEYISWEKKYIDYIKEGFKKAGLESYLYE